MSTTTDFNCTSSATLVINLASISPALTHASTKHALFGSRILVLGLTETDRNILVFVHVHDLSFHGHEEEDKKVEQEDGPEDGHIEKAKEGHGNGCQNTLEAGEPEFEFGKSSCERSVLLGLAVRRWQRRAFVGVVEGRQEGNEVVQQKDSQSIRYDEITLHEIDAQKEEY